MMGRKANWLYDTADRPIIHSCIAKMESRDAGPLDRVALACQGKKEILARLQARRPGHAVADHRVPGQTRVFLKDPHGVALKLHFSGE